MKRILVIGSGIVGLCSGIELIEYFMTMDGVNLSGGYNSGKTGLIPIFDLNEINLSTIAFHMIDWEGIEEDYELNLNGKYNFFPIIVFFNWLLFRSSFNYVICLEFSHRYFIL